MLAVEHLCRHHESLSHIEVSLGRGLNEVLDVVILAESLALLGGDLPLCVPIGLVAHQDDNSIGLALGTYLIEPVCQVLEALHACYRVGKEHGMSAAVENLGNRLERLLSGCVPDLELEH